MKKLDKHYDFYFFFPGGATLYITQFNLETFAVTFQQTREFKYANQALNRYNRLKSCFGLPSFRMSDWGTIVFTWKINSSQREGTNG